MAVEAVAVVLAIEPLLASLPRFQATMSAADHGRDGAAWARSDVGGTARVRIDGSGCREEWGNRDDDDEDAASGCHRLAAAYGCVRDEVLDVDLRVL